ncbi:hypothetical protein [Novosphingobium terrae]|uniref:hypothetical protein n=1 Tax=Novosphingobium terrae TaxID=2726189 RepID=UPI00197E1C12|nr:hypothetical protein [Novosphingobium terrae]
MKLIDLVDDAPDCRIWTVFYAVFRHCGFDAKRFAKQARQPYRAASALNQDAR